jgi:hypothetical protein
MRFAMKRKADDDVLHVSTPLIALCMRLAMKRKADDVLHVSTPLIALCMRLAMKRKADDVLLIPTVVNFPTDMRRDRGEYSTGSV